MNIINELYNQIDAQNLWDKTLALKRNDNLKLQGTIDTHLYYIVSGSLKLSIMIGDEEQIIRFGYKDNFITALDSFITEKASPFIFQAIKKTEIKVITKSAYLELILQSEENKMMWDKLLEQLILQQLEREIDILTTNPKARYERVLARSPQLFQEIPHKYIASYLRMTPETLSRLQKS